LDKIQIAFAPWRFLAPHVRDETYNLHFFSYLLYHPKINVMKQLPAFLFISILFLSCNNVEQPVVTNTVDSAAMTKETMLNKNKAAALGFLHAINDKNLDAMVKDFAVDYVDYHDGNETPSKGLDTLKIDLKNFVTAFPDVRADSLVAVAEGNQVAIFGVWSGTFKANLGKLKATGKSFKVKDADLFTFNDAGKIIEHRAVQSGEALMSQVMKK
jgi:predicted ester cyclase